MSSRIKIIGIILLIVIGLVAVFYNFKESKPLATETNTENNQIIIGENLEGEADPSRMKLDMKEWVWISAVYNDSRTISPGVEKEGKFTLTFGNDGRFSVKTDCNSMGGSYSTSTIADTNAGTNAGANLISFSEMFSTKMYCEGSIEDSFAELLRNTTEYHFTSRGHLVLDLKFDSGSVIFR